MGHSVHYRRLIQIALAWLLGLACQVKPSTGILLRINATLSVYSIRMEARNIDYQGVALTDYNVVNKDLTSSAMVVLVQPSGVIQDTFLIRIRGYNERNELVAQAAKVLTFRQGEQIDASVQLVREFIDDDDDGFVRCNGGDGCDCDDGSRMVNPFSLELCDDSIDNNCNGQINEGCPCVADVPCSNLPFEIAARQAGIGACTFGILKCQGGILDTVCNSGMPVEEIDNDFVDNDCDGTVDEGSRCEPGQTRPCHRGFVDDANHPNPEERLGAKQRALGICGLDGAGGAGGVQSCEQDTASRWRWGACLGDVLPQRDNRPQRIGFAELAPGMVPGDLAQCNGLDDDCNGIVDDALEYDSDKDGYSRCGSNPANNTVLKAEEIDCNDSDKLIHPGATELCGNNIDEDCRCDHDPSNRARGTEGSLIGLPSVQINVLSAREGQQVAVCRNANALQCSRDIRSDDNPVGNCGQGANALYLGYQNNNCYGCNQSYGLSCSSQGRCSTKQEDCRVCTNNQLSDNLITARPTCNNLQAGTCDKLTAPVFAPSNGQDLFGECPGFACSTYYYGDGNGNCFVRNNVSDAAAVCGNNGACLDATVLCPQQAGTLQPTPVCRLLSGGCATGNPPQYNNVSNGQDPNNDCKESYQCSDPNNSPYYAGIVNRVCYYKADVADNVCNGNAACRSKAEACTAAAQGNVAVTAGICKSIDPNTCTGTTAPVVSNVGNGNDTFNECNDTFTCGNNSGGSGPFYGLDPNRRCYFKSDVPNSACNGLGSCQSKMEACLAALVSSTEVPGRLLCQYAEPTLSCRDSTAPSYINIPLGQDYFNECPGARTCNGSGACTP